MDIKDQIQEVIRNYPTLSYNEKDNSIEGELFISSYDSYDVKINISKYPYEFPHVYEEGERIPRVANRHIYTDTGSCCLTTKAKAQILLKTKIFTLSMFIKDIVIPYFQNNSYYEINKQYKTNEYGHDKLGIIQGYHDILKTTNNMKIANLIQFHLTSPNKLRLHDMCYCGSGLTFKKCNSGKHFDCYKDFRKIEHATLHHDLQVFRMRLGM